MSDLFGDRMKLYEQAEAGRKLMPALARLDGKGFSKFTQGMKRPFDEKLVALIQNVTKFLVQETGACCGYTQSDEISLAWLSTDFNSQIWFDGKIQKMCSVLAATCTARFLDYLQWYFSQGVDYRNYPVFDCRVWNVPSYEECANTFLWRELDATKNSVSMAAREYYSHKELHGLGRADMMDILIEKGVNWNNYPSHFKRGTYFLRRTVKRGFTDEERADLPLNHAARKDPNLKVERTEVYQADLPPLSKIKNRIRVLLFGQEPVLAESV